MLSISSSVAVLLLSTITLSAAQKSFPPSFGNSCLQQQQQNSKIDCDGQGRFSPLQCDDGVCWCVDPEDGSRIRLDSFPEDKATNTSCKPEEPCPEVLCALFCENGYEENDEGCEICKCREDDCEYTEVEEIAKMCGGKRCVSYNSTTNCAECNKKCGNMDDDEVESCDECLPSQDCVRKGYGYVTCQDKLSNGTVCKRPSEVEEDDNGPFDDDDEDDRRNRGRDGDEDGPTDSGSDRKRNTDDDEDGDAREDTEPELDNVAEGTGLASASPDFRRIVSSDTEDEEEIEAKRQARESVGGASARYVLKSLGIVEEECTDGHYCEKTTELSNGRCTPVNNDGPCTMRNDVDPNRCDSNGYYKPRYCWKISSRPREVLCACFHPMNGSMVPRSRVIAPADDRDEDSPTLPDDASIDSVPVSDEKPICTDRVYESCIVVQRNRTIEVSHGRTYVDHCGCRKCQCLSGELYCGSPQNICERGCQLGSCTLRGRTIQHRQTVRIDCNNCSCAYGNLFCTERNCDDDDDDDDDDDEEEGEGTDRDSTDGDRDSTDGDQDGSGDDEEDRPCDVCRKQPVRKVCGRSNGVTYPNKCFAVMCAGISPVDLIDEPCQRINPCALYPCDAGERCVVKGGASCLRRGDCRDELRVCVQVQELRCSYQESNASRETPDEDDEDRTGDQDELGSGDVDASDTTVCGTDNRTYPSVCHLLQSTVNEHVLHAGSCGARQCRGGPVCGTDGVTYDNVCILHSLSANGRVDYRGPCVDEDDSNPNVTYDDVCSVVSSQGRCRFTSENCDYLVRPSTGCCPICGGVVTVAVDAVSIGEAAELDDGLQTLDDLGAYVATDVELDEVAERCIIYFYWTNKGSLEITLQARDLEEDDQFCYDQAVFITEILSDIDDIKSPATQYMLTASSASALRQESPPSTVEGGNGEDGGTDPNGAVATSLSILSVMIAAFSLLLL